MENTSSTPPTGPREAVDLERGSALLAEMTEAVQGAERSLAQAVLIAGELVGSGVAERVQGLPLELVLAVACRLTGQDRGALLTCADTLRTLPAVSRLFAEGELSWGQVRRVCDAARRVTVDRRAVLDSRIAATCAEHGGLDGFNPDGLCDQVDSAADQLRDPRNVERAEQRRQRGDRVTVQSDFEGGLSGYFSLGPITGAIFLNALAHQMAAADNGSCATEGQPEDGGDGAGEDADQAAPDVWARRDRGRRQAQALLAMCAASLAGVFASGAPRPAKPLFIAHVQADQATRTAAGVVQLDVPGPLPTITARLVEALCGAADLQAVIFDGHRPLAVSKKLFAKDLPADTRLAVRARDLGSRFPGSVQPVGRCDVHHLVHVADGGTHAVDNVALFGEWEHHQPLHRYGWHGRIDPETGELVLSRRDRTLRVRRRATPLSAAPGREPGGPGPPASGDPPGDPPAGDPPPGRDPPNRRAAEGLIDDRIGQGPGQYGDLPF